MAGNGTEATVDGPAGAASFTDMGGVAVVGDYAFVGTAGAIRRVHLATGATTTLAGAATPNSACTNSTDPAAVRFGVIKDVTTDGSYVYTVSTCNAGSLIRRTSIATGATSTVATGANRITYGADGNLYASLSGNLKRVDPTTGATTTVASFTGTANGVAADSDSIWFAVANTSTNRPIHRYTLADGALSTLVSPADIGTGTLASAGDYLYASGDFNAGDKLIRRYRKSDGALAAVAGTTTTGFVDATGTDAWFGRIAGIASDGSKLLVADSDNHRLRVVSPTAPLPAAQPAAATTNLVIGPGSVTTVAGNGTNATVDGPSAMASFRLMGGVAVVGDYAYVGTDGSIRKVNIETGAVTTLAGQAVPTGYCTNSANPTEVNFPRIDEMTTDGHYLYTVGGCGPTGGQVRRTSLATGATSTVAWGVSAATITFGPDGNLYVGSGASGVLYRIDPVTGTRETAATMPYPWSAYGVAADATDVWILASRTSSDMRLYRFSLADATLSIVSSSAAVANGITLASAGDYLYADGTLGWGIRSVVRFRKSDGATETVAGTNVIGYADGIGPRANFGGISAIASDGERLWVADTGNFRLRAVDLPFFDFDTQNLLGWMSSAGHAADPVNTASGNFVDSVADLNFPPAVFGLGWSRTYNSQEPSPAELGPGWSTPGRASIAEEASGDVVVTRSDGRRARFAASGPTYLRPEDFFATLTKQADGTFSLTYDDGHVEQFASSGRLATVTNWDGQQVTYAYVNGVLASMTSSTGYTLSLAYTGALLSSVTSSDGRVVGYGYTNGRLSSVTDAAGGVTTFDYDGSGRLSRITDPDGVLVVASVYDADGRVIQQTTPSGDTVTFSYNLSTGVTTVAHAAGGSVTRYGHDPAGRLVSMTDAYGKVMSKAYDGSGNLVGITDRRGGATSQTFDAHGNLLTHASPEAVAESWTYDSIDRLLSYTNGENETTTYAYESTERSPSMVTDGNGKTTTFVVGADGLVSSMTDADGVTLAYGYDTKRNLTTITDEHAKVWTRTYDAAGNLATVTSPLGHTTTYVFDGRRRLLSRTDPTGAAWSQTWSPGGRRSTATEPPANTSQSPATTTFGYDSAGRLGTTTDAAGNVTTHGYDADDNVTSVARPGGSTSTATYDKLGRRLSDTDPTGVTLAYGYDDDGHLTSTTDEAGKAVVRTHDLRGRLTSERDQLGFTRSYSWDRGDRLASVTDAEGATTSYLYDDAGRVVETTLSGPGIAARTAKATFTAAGRPWRAIAPDQSPLPAPKASVSSYDDVGRLRTLTGPEGAATTYGHDADGRLTSLRSAEGRITSFAYDAAARLTTTTNPAGGVTVRTYWPRGLPKTVAEPEQDAAWFFYDALGRLVTTMAPNGALTTFAHDGRGNVTTRTDARGGVARWTYDLADRPLTASDPLDSPTVERTTTSTYDDLGRLASVLDPSGRSVAYAYDAAGRVITKTFADDTTVSLAYDKVGRRTSMVDPAGSSAWTYNRAGELTAYRRDATTLSYGHDLAGNRTSLTYPDGTVASFTYDADHRLTGLSHPAAAVSYGYNDDDQLVTETLPGVSRSYGYDTAGRMTSHTEARLEGTRTSILGYDGANRITSEALGAELASYGYDEAGQLTSVTRNGIATTYDYDDVGNRVGETTGAVATAYAYDASQQITGLTRTVAGITSGSLSFDHDNAGRLTAITGAEGARTLTYGAQGYLARIVDVRGLVQATTERTTDGDGALLSSVTTGTVTPRSTSFSWDPHDPVRQIVTLTASGNTANLVYGMGRALAVRGGNAAVFAQDPHGSTLAIGAAADLARAGGYDEYGVPSGSTTPTLLDEVTGDATGAGSDHQALFGYRGEAHVSGMVDLRARSYVPALGSFTTVDPLDGVPGEVTTANPYHYANNDPLNQIDPLGLRPLNDSDMRLISNTRGRGVWGWTGFKQTLGGVFDSGKGVVTGTSHLVTNPTQLWRVPENAYRDFGGGLEGTLAAINQFNPIYHGLYSAEACLNGFDSGDAYAAGHGCANLILDAAATAAIAEAAAAGVTRGTTAVRNRGVFDERGAIGGEPIPGRPFTGKNAPDAAFSHLEQYHGLDPAVASNRLHRLKTENGLGPADDVVIGRTGDVYDAVTGERLGSLTDPGLGGGR